jgi:DNA-binding response OmpR family regulator
MQKRILILDDNEDILLPCCLILERAGYYVATRTSSNQILQDVMDVNPDIILLDLKIPPLGGEHILNLLKENLLTRNIHVLLFSAAGGLEALARKYQADGFIQKPFDINILLEKVRGKLIIQETSFHSSFPLKKEQSDSK